MMVNYDAEPNRALTQEELELLEKAKKKAPVFDEENPPFTEDELLELRNKAKAKLEQMDNTQ